MENFFENDEYTNDLFSLVERSFSTCWFKYCLELSPDNFTFFQRTICHYWAVNSTVITKEKGHKLILLPSFIFVSLHV